MTNRYTMLPVMMVVVIAFLALYVMNSGRSNDTGLVGDPNYPFHICTFNDYCEGPTCTREGASFLVYLEHANGRPLLELARVNPAATMEPIPSGLALVTSGGEVSGTLSIFTDRQMEFSGTSGTADDPVEHYATGTCERLKTP
jgi:hypothetical protein